MAGETPSSFMDLSNELIELVAHQLDHISDVLAFFSCCTYLHQFGKSIGGQQVIVDRLIRHARTFQSPPDDWRYYDYLRRLAIAQVRLKTGAKWEVSTTPLLPYTPMQYEDDDGFGGEVFSGVAQICYGLKIGIEDLMTLIYVGRRWYDNNFAYDLPKSKDGSITLLSQPLSEDPYDGEECYSEFHDEDDLETYFYPSLACLEPHRHARRPPGVKSWKGPCLKYHLPVALQDVLVRAGLASATSVQDRDGLLGLTFTGFMDEAGDEVILGIQLGPQAGKNGYSAMPLGQSAFDIYHATDRTMSFTSREWDNHIQKNIEPLSLEYVSALIGIPPASNKAAMLDGGLRERVTALLTAIDSGAHWNDLSYYVAFDGNC